MKKPSVLLFKHARPLQRRRDSSAQIITLMGVSLAIAVLVIATFASEITDLDIVVSNERASSLLPEFTYIKESFGKALNYALTNVSTITFESGSGWPWQASYFVNFSTDNISFDQTSRLIYAGKPSNITQVFEEIRNLFFYYELHHNRYFEATLNRFWYAHRTDVIDLYYASVTLSLDNGNSYLTEDVQYSIYCRPIDIEITEDVTFILGDINNDGSRNGADITRLVVYLRGIITDLPPPFIRADVNGDCMVNQADVFYLVNYFKGGPPPVLGDCIQYY